MLIFSKCFHTHTLFFLFFIIFVGGVNAQEDCINGEPIVTFQDIHPQILANCTNNTIHYKVCNCDYSLEPVTYTFCIELTPKKDFPEADANLVADGWELKNRPDGQFPCCVKTVTLQPLSDTSNGEECFEGELEIGKFVPDGFKGFASITTYNDPQMKKNQIVKVARYDKQGNLIQDLKRVSQFYNDFDPFGGNVVGYEGGTTSLSSIAIFNSIALNSPTEGLMWTPELSLSS